MFRPVMTAMLLAGALGACAGVETLSANQIERSVKTNSEVELAHWAYWNDACEGEPFDTTIVQAPAHGQTELRDAVFAIPTKTSSGATTGCVDKIIESTKVFYIPEKDFKGADKVVVRFSGSSGTVTNVYAITVR